MKPCLDLTCCPTNVGTGRYNFGFTRFLLYLSIPITVKRVGTLSFFSNWKRVPSELRCSHMRVGLAILSFPILIHLRFLVLAHKCASCHPIITSAHKNKMKITTLKKVGHMFLFVTHVPSEILDLDKNFKTKTQRCGTLYSTCGLIYTHPWFVQN